MTDEQPNNPLHGVTLKVILEQLVERHGWAELADRIKIRCFQNDPSLTSSLKFLRKTDWARQRVEQLYLADLHLAARNRKRNKRRAEMRAVRARNDAAAAQEAEPGAAPSQAPPDEVDEEAADAPDTEGAAPRDA